MACLLVVLAHVGAKVAAVNDVRVKRIGGDVAILSGANRVPLPNRNLAVISAAAHHRGAAFLLAAIHPIRELVVGAHVIELGGRLVVPTAPSFARVDAHASALIAAEQDDAWVVGVDLAQSTSLGSEGR